MSALSRAAMPGRATTTMSAAGSRHRESRNDSLTNLLIRFRGAPPPAARTDTARPRRGGPLSAGRASTVNSSSAERVLRRKTRVKAPRFRRRCAGRNRVSNAYPAGRRRLRASDGRALWRDAGPGPHDHSSWPCGHESRGFACGGCCSAERCASWVGPLLAKSYGRDVDPARKGAES